MKKIVIILIGLTGITIAQAKNGNGNGTTAKEKEYADVCEAEYNKQCGKTPKSYASKKNNYNGKKTNNKTELHEELEVESK